MRGSGAPSEGFCCSTAMRVSRGFVDCKSCSKQWLKSVSGLGQQCTVRRC